MRTGTAFRDSAFTVVAKNRPDGLAVAFFIIAYKILPVPILGKGNDLREFIDPVLLIFGRVRIIKGPLSEGDVSADKVQ